MELQVPQQATRVGNPSAGPLQLPPGFWLSPGCDGCVPWALFVTVFEGGREKVWNLGSFSYVLVSGKN